MGSVIDRLDSVLALKALTAMLVKDLNVQKHAVGMGSACPCGQWQPCQMLSRLVRLAKQIMMICNKAKLGILCHPLDASAILHGMWDYHTMSDSLLNGLGQAANSGDVRR